MSTTTWCAPRSRLWRRRRAIDRKSTRLNSSHSQISYAVFCLKKKKKYNKKHITNHNYKDYTQLHNLMTYVTPLSLGSLSMFICTDPRDISNTTRLSSTSLSTS